MSRGFSCLMQISGRRQVNTTGVPLWLQTGSAQEEIHALEAMASQNQVRPVEDRNPALRRAMFQILNPIKKSLSGNKHYCLEFLYFIYNIYYSMEKSIKTILKMTKIIKIPTHYAVQYCYYEIEALWLPWCCSRSKARIFLWQGFRAGIQVNKYFKWVQ